MREFLSRLSSRERALVLAAGAVVLLALVARFLVFPAMEERARLSAAANRMRADAAEMSSLAAQYRDLSARVRKAEAALGEGKGGSLLSQLEGQAESVRLRSRIASMKPLRNRLESGMWESSVEVRVERVTLAEATALLEKVEGLPGRVRVRRFHLKTRFDDPSLLDAVLLASTLEGGE